MRGLLPLVVLPRGWEKTPLPLIVLQRGPINRHRRPLGRNVLYKLGNAAVLTPLPRNPCQFKHRISLEVRHLKRLGQHVTTLAMPKTISPQELSLVATFDPVREVVNSLTPCSFETNGYHKAVFHSQGKRKIPALLEQHNSPASSTILAKKLPSTRDKR